MNKRKLLIIDDDKTILKTMSDRFRLEGFEVVTASDGHSGMTCADLERPDLILIDVLLPDLNGNEVCRMIKERSPQSSPLIIILTGKIDAVDALRAKKAGADDFLVKDTNYQTLVNGVKNLLMI